MGSVLLSFFTVAPCPGFGEGAEHGSDASSSFTVVARRSGGERFIFQNQPYQQ